MRKTALPIFIILFSILTGCASSPKAPPEKDMEAKQFIVPNGKSNIYLYRNTIIGFQKSMPVSLDNKRAGITGANTYIRWVVVPGKHVVVSHPAGSEPSRVIIDTVAGKNYYIWQEVISGPSSELHMVSEEEGQNGVRECELIEMEINKNQAITDDDNPAFTDDD